VVAALGPAYLEEIGVTEHGIGGGIAAARVPPYAGAVEVDPRIVVRELFDGGDLVRECVIAHIAEPVALETGRAERRADAVDRHHDEAQLGQRLIVIVRRQEAESQQRADQRARIDIVDDRIFLMRIEVGRLEQQAVEIRFAVARLDDDWLGRLPADGAQAGDIGLRYCREDSSGLSVVQCGNRRLRWGGAIVDEIFAVRVHADNVIANLRREQCGLSTVQARLPQLLVIRIHARDAFHCAKPHGARLAVQVQHLGNVAGARSDGMLELPGSQAVEVEVPPIVAIAIPDCLIRARQIAPVHRADAVAFIVGRDAALVPLGKAILECRADRSRSGIGDAEPLVPAIPRAGHERQGLRVSRPLQVVPVPVVVTASDVIAEAREALLRGQAQAHDFARGEVDDHGFDHENVLVSRQGVFPFLQVGMAHLGADQVHVTDFSLVLLVGGDLPRIRRPVDYREVGVQPGCVVGCVAEVPHPVGRELGFLSGGDIPYPQVPVTDEGEKLLVGRKDSRLLASLCGLGPVYATANARQVA
jgi:hypothetical protein